LTFLGRRFERTLIYNRIITVAEKKVLIVDYDTRSVETISRLLRPHNVRIETAGDGLTAWEKYLLEKPDLVVLEAILPKLHGFDLTKRIVQDAQGTVPVVIVTGLYRGPQYRHEALTSFGASEYFEKPLDEARFLDCALSLLKERVDIRLDLPSPAEVIEFLKKKLDEPAAPGKNPAN
jgi:DNA-binding response OmpR family regulator